MSYEYDEQREELFTEEGQRQFLAMRDWCDKLLEAGGAFRMQEAMKAPGVRGDTWRMLACVDRLVELGEIYEITPEGTVQQHRIFSTHGRRPR
jgi:hypothetical protein